MPLPSLRRHLEGILPRYMVPNRIYHFPQIPLNVNGKIDRGKITEMLGNWGK